MTQAVVVSRRWPTSLALAALSLLVVAPSVQAAPNYSEIRGSRPDGRQITTTGVTIERDAFTFEFGQGKFHLLAESEGRTFGAVFIGQGSYTLKPSTKRERHYLAFRASKAGLETFGDTFTEAILLFADDTPRSLITGGQAAVASPDSKATKVYEDYLDRQRKKFHKNVHQAVLRGFLNDEPVDPFYAYVNGKNYPPVLISVDSQNELSESSCLYVDDDTRGGYWYSEKLIGQTDPHARPTDAEHYVIDIEIEGDNDLIGLATIRFKATRALQVLPFDLTATLRIEDATWITEDGEKPLIVIQEDKKDDAEPAVVFPERLPQGTTATIRLNYRGDGVLRDAGDRNFSVRARSSWYPNLGEFTDPATFELNYKVPANNTVISVGSHISTSQQGKHTVSQWKAEAPIKVAGFNYGEFKLYEQKEKNSGLTLQVYTSPGTPDAIAELNEAMRAITTGSVQDAVDAAGDGTNTWYRPGGLGSSRISLNTEYLAQSAMADAVNSVQVFTNLFGPLDHNRLAITQQSEISFGQAWPTLIFLPYLLALDSTQRRDLGMGNATSNFVDSVTIHEVAHQWWGHKVGWKTYRDQWLSEGFAEFSTAMVLQMTRGWPAYDVFWENWHRRILSKARGSAVISPKAGAITQGLRLQTPRSESAHQDLVYGKGAFVLHMMRMLMRDTKNENPDGRFLAMMRDFADSYAGQSATTDDFKTVVERHLIRELDPYGDGKADWFFDQWVHGTEIPRYEIDAKIEKAGRGKYRIVGSIKQHEVSEEFLALVPMYLDFGKGNYGMFGRAPMKGLATQEFDTTMELPKKPKRVVANAHYDVLAYE